MALRIVAGTANPALAGSVAGVLGIESASAAVERFPDGELRPVVEGLWGADVNLVQPTGPPVNEHVMELLLLVDACRRAGAARITAVIPYFGYARQDRRARAGQAIGIRVVADALASAGVWRLIVVDPHTVALEAICAVAVEMLAAVPSLARALGEQVPDGAVVVAPDLGAVKLAEHYGALLSRPVAVVRKTRLSGTRVVAEELVGDVRDRPVVIVDDMISTGGTIEAAAEVVAAHGAAPEIVVVATHRLFVAPAAEAGDAAAIVVGGRGLDGFAGLLLGSVGLGLAGHVAGPVVVVRGTSTIVQGEIVTGLDPEDAVHPALDYAFEEAQARGARLRVVHAWDVPSSRLGPEIIAQALQERRNGAVPRAHRSRHHLCCAGTSRTRTPCCSGGTGTR